MFKLKKRLLLMISVAFFVAITCFIVLTGNYSAYAATTNSDESFNFTLVTDGAGEQHYSVAIKPAIKPNVEIVIIPEMYNGLYVEEIANNGFMSCANLTKVVLPTSIKKIGNNAFMNCAKLERVGLPSVESIGMNAFSMCPKLDRIFIPQTVKSVGANILRNNSNTIYVQKSEEEISSEWQST